MNSERLKRFISNAKADHRTDDEIWNYITGQSRSTFISNAKADHRTDDEIKQYLGLSSTPRINIKSSANIPALTALPNQKPTAFEKAFEKAKEFGQQKLSATALPIQNPPATAELRALPGQAENVKGFWDAKGNFILLGQYERSVDYRKQIENLRNAPTGDYKLQAFAQGALPIASKEQLPPGLEKAFPVSYYAGKIVGETIPAIMTGGKSLLNIPVRYGMKYGVEQPVSSFLTEGKGKQWEDVLLEAGTGKGTATGVATAIRILSNVVFWQGASRLMGSPSIKDFLGVDSKSMVPESEQVRAAIDKGDWQTVADYFQKNPGMVQEVSGKNLHTILRNIKEYDPQIYQTLYDSLMTQTAKRTVSSLTPSETVQPYTNQVPTLWEKTIGTMDKPQFEGILTAKLPGFEALSSDVKNLAVNTVINELAGGKTVDEAVDYAAKIMNPLSDQELRQIMISTGNLPPDKQFEQVIPPPWEGTSLVELKDQRDPKQLAKEIKKTTTPLPTPDQGQFTREMIAASESVTPSSFFDEKEIMRQELLRQQKEKEAKALTGKKTPGFLQTAEQKLGKELKERIGEPTPDFLKTAEDKLKDRILQDKDLKKEVIKEIKAQGKKITLETVKEEIKKKIEVVQKKPSGIGFSPEFSLPFAEKPELTKKIEELIKPKGKIKAEKIPEVKESEMPKATVFTAEGEKPLLPVGTANKAQKTIAHDLAKKAGISEKEYRDLAVKVIDVPSTTNMSKEQAQTFIHAIDKQLRQKEDQILSSPLVSRDRRMKVLDARNERVRQIGLSVVPSKETAMISEIIKEMTTNPEAARNLSEDFKKDYKEASVVANFVPIQFELRRNKHAYGIGKRIYDASVNKTEFVLNAKKELRQAAKGLTEQDLIDIRRFREGLPTAPSILTPEQTRFNDFLQKKWDELHQVFGVKGYVKGYISRMTPAEIQTWEEKIIESLYGEIDEKGQLVAGSAKIPGHINEWFKKRRTGFLEGAEENALTIFEKYVNTGAKAMFFQDIINEAKDILPRLEKFPKMKGLLENYLFRALGYPDPNESAWVATLRDAHEFLMKTVGFKQATQIASKIPYVKKIIPALIDEKQAYDVARFLIDTTYMRTMGLRPQMFFQQLLQTLNNTVPQLGYGWSSVGLQEVLLNHGIEKAKKDGILKEFAPEMYKEHGQNVTAWDKIRNALMIFNLWGDKINRGIVYNGAIRKFDYHLKGYGISKDIPKFMHKLEAVKFHRRIREDMINALKDGKVDESRRIYATYLTKLTHYDYEKEAAPMITRSAVGKVANQFLSWPVNYAEFYIEAANPEHGKNWKLFARQALMYAMIAGIASKSSKKTKQFVMKSIGVGPFEHGIEYSAIPPSLDPEAKTTWMVIKFIEAVMREPLDPGFVKEWAKRYEKDLYTLKQYEPLIFKDIERWLK